MVWKRVIAGGRVLLLLAGIIPLTRCTYEFPEQTTDINSGSLSVTSVVFLGDDYLSGFMDGALYSEGQQHGVSAVLAGAFKNDDQEPFIQADIASENGKNSYVSDPQGIAGRYILKYEGISSTEAVIETVPGEEIADFSGDKSAVNDLSVPFLKSYQFLLNTVTGNDYYSRIVADPGNHSLLHQASLHQPTAFVLWIGMSDLLHYAVSGGLGDTLPSSDPQLNQEPDLTTATLFRSSLEQVVSELLTTPEAKGIIFTLPDFDDLPFFYYYPYNFMKLTNAQKSLAGSFYSAFNDAVAKNNMVPGNPKRPFIGFNDNGVTLYPQPLVVVDSLLPDAFYPDGTTPLPKIRNLVEGEEVFLTIPVDKMDQGYGWLTPVDQKYYLNLEQIQLLHQRTDAYNQAIADIAAMYPDRLSVVDIGDLIHNIADTGRENGWGTPASTEEYTYDGVPLSGRLDLNGIFSLDGLHFNQRGAAYVASLAITEANSFFGATFPDIDVNNYKGNIPQF